MRGIRYFILRMPFSRIVFIPQTKSSPLDQVLQLIMGTVYGTKNYHFIFAIVRALFRLLFLRLIRYYKAWRAYVHEYIASCRSTTST